MASKTFHGKIKIVNEIHSGWFRKFSFFYLFRHFNEFGGAVLVGVRFFCARVRSIRDVDVLMMMRVYSREKSGVAAAGGNWKDIGKGTSRQWRLGLGSPPPNPTPLRLDGWTLTDPPVSS